MHYILLPLQTARHLVKLIDNFIFFDIHFFVLFFWSLFSLEKGRSIKKKGVKRKKNMYKKVYKIGVK